jgi:hypothetical protein
MQFLATLGIFFVVVLIYLALKGYSPDSSGAPEVQPTESSLRNEVPQDLTGRKLGTFIAGCFDAKQFKNFFENMQYKTGWYTEDALGVWYSLGYFCLLTSISRSVSVREIAEPIVRKGFEALLSTWELPSPSRVRDRFNYFNSTQIGTIIDVFRTIDTPLKMEMFFFVYMLEVRGETGNFHSSMFEPRVMAELVFEHKPETVLTRTLVEIFLGIVEASEQLLPKTNPVFVK